MTTLPCPTHRRGFTLIEVMVSVTIMLLLVGGGIAGYNTFNDRQTVIQEGKQFASMLRLAQKRASVGDKPTVCAGNKLQGYYVIRGGEANTYQLWVACNNDAFLLQTVTMPSSVTFAENVNLQFNVFGGVVLNAPVSGSFVLQSSNWKYTIEVTRTGAISEQGLSEAN